MVIVKDVVIPIYYPTIYDNPNTAILKFGRALIRDIRTEFEGVNKVFDCFLVDYGFEKTFSRKELVVFILLKVINIFYSILFVC